MRFWQKKVDKTVLITSGLLGIVLGLFLTRFFQLFSVYYLILALPLILVGLKKKLIAVLAILLAGFIVGQVRGVSFANQVAKYDQFYGKKVTIVGQVVDDTGYDDKRQTEFHLGGVFINGQSLPGRVRVRGFGATEVTRGDTVRAEGKLNKTLGTGRQGSLSYAEIEVLENDKSLVNKIRGKFFASVYSALPEPQASLGLGFLVGVRSSLPKNFNDQMAIVGLTHIVAVSGYNLTIIVQAVKRLFEKRSAYQTVVFSGLLIIGFLLMTGWSPSIMRASIISGFSLLAWYYGRQFKPSVIIFLGAAITGMISPLYVWGDVGWYLSFLAFAGVLILAPLISKLIYKKREPHVLAMILIETFSAQLLTLPYIAMIFGKLSIISPLANIMVLPFIPYIMLLVFILGVVGMISPVLALWFALVPRAFLTLNVWTIEKLSALKFAQSSFKLSIFGMLIGYIVIAFLTLWLKHLYDKKLQIKQVNEINWNLL